MNSTALSVQIPSGPIEKWRMLEPMDEERTSMTTREHDELGETVFYELSPIYMALYYAFDPDMNMS